MGREGIALPSMMPYHLEKGATLRLLERHLNRPHDELRPMLDALRGSKGTVDWLFAGANAPWGDPKFNVTLPNGQVKTGASTAEDIARLWLGFEEDAQGRWVPESPTKTTTGYWIAYKGDVNEIVRHALIWALELALGLEPGCEGEGRQNPWKIELWWKCPTPWFEAWVVDRAVTMPSHAAPSESRRRLVSVVFMTPSHQGSNVSETPIAHSPVSMPPGATHPVPSWQDDYEQLGQPHPDPVHANDRPRVAAEQRPYASWVVTHHDHVTSGTVDVTTDTTAAADFADWGIPQLSIYNGLGEIVIVSPSMAAGGVKEDGEV